MSMNAMEDVVRLLNRTSGTSHVLQKYVVQQLDFSGLEIGKAITQTMILLVGYNTEMSGTIKFTTDKGSGNEKALKNKNLFYPNRMKEFVLSLLRNFYGLPRKSILKKLLAWCAKQKFYFNHSNDQERNRQSVDEEQEVEHAKDAIIKDVTLAQTGEPDPLVNSDPSIQEACPFDEATTDFDSFMNLLNS